jgi:BirA family biotin operon repressor/biotin-[acetyl-CoA-carboxylase] ligase
MRTQILESCDSTNDQLKRLICAKDFQAPAAVIACAQTAGRGRLGRPWNSPPGGVYFSLIVEAPAPPERLSSLPLIVALAVREVLAAQKVPAANIAIKWPNDILAVDNSGTALGKLAGILVETLEQMAAPRLAIIGTGINIQPPPPNSHPSTPSPQTPTANCQPFPAPCSASSSLHPPTLHSPRSTPLPPVYLSELRSTRDAAPDPILLAQRALDSIENYLGRWAASNYDFAPFLSAYLQHLAIMNRQIEVRDLCGTLLSSGTVSGISEHGELLLITADGQRQAFSSGEVTLSPNR